MAKFNPDDIYHKASNGRLQNTTDSNESYYNVHFISIQVEGSEQDEQEKQRWRENESIRLDDKLGVRIILLFVAICVLTFADFLYGKYLPVINYFIKAAAIILFVILIHYLVRQHRITKASRKFRERNKNKK